MTRKTKKQREAELLQRIEDIYAGVIGDDPAAFSEDYVIDVTQLSNVVGALQTRLDLPEGILIFSNYNCMGSLANPYKFLRWIQSHSDHIKAVKRREEAK